MESAFWNTISAISPLKDSKWVDLKVIYVLNNILWKGHVHYIIVFILTTVLLHSENNIDRTVLK